MTTAGEAHVLFDIPIPMRDGARLFADAYLPATSGRFPVLLCRTPYDKSLTFSRAPGSGGLGLAAVKRGFAVVVQDTRGRHSSEGEFRPFLSEAQDGYDTIECLADMPWSNGTTGMFGGSYVGATQWLAATAQPPHLNAIAPTVTASDYHEGWSYQGGAFELGFNLSWTLGALTMRNGQNLKRRLGLTDRRLEELIDNTDDMASAFRTLPLTQQPRVRQEEAGYYYEWLSHPSADGFWNSIRIEDHHTRIGIPTLNIAGWHDIFLMGSIRNFERMKHLAATAAAREAARLVIGPWSHTGLASNATGAIDFGQRAGTTGLDLDEMQISWYESVLLGKRSTLPPVRIFVMGENRWRDEQEWPLKRAKRTRLFLRSNGRANTRKGDGVLSMDPPAPGEPADRFVYDPLDPVPTMGGGLCCAPWPGALPAGPMNQATKEERGDILVYSTPPLQEEVEVTGPIKVTLWASSSSVDTDFTAMLCDVGPDGSSWNLTDGIIRARWRASRSQPVMLRPGEPVTLEIDLAGTSNLFKQGHRIRLEVSSSNFPRFDRNLNTGKGFDSGDSLRATNTVYHEDERRSYVELDIVPR